MKYVYILESHDFEHFYAGITDDVPARLAKHNAGGVSHTSKYRPWRLKTYVAFSDEKRAFAFVWLRPGVCEEASVMLNALDVLSTKLRKKRPSNAHDDRK
jgi:putative endonuclease